MPHNVYRKGTVHIQRVQCNSCIFKPGSPIPRERVAQMRADSEAGMSCIVCHDTLDTDNAACRGHLDAGCPILQIAVRLKAVTWVRKATDDQHK